MKNDDPTPDRKTALAAHRQRTAVNAWEGRSAFSEEFLSWFTDPEDAQAMRRVSDMLYNSVFEYRQYFPDEAEDFMRADLRAALGGLRNVEATLAEIGRSVRDDEPPKDSKLAAERLDLARLAAKKAFAVALIADAIERRIGPAPGR